MMKKIFLFILAIATFQISAQDTLHVVQFAGIGALTKTVVAGESLQAGEAVYINPTSKKAFRANHTLAPSKADAQAVCLWDAATDSTTLIITSGRITDWPTLLNIGETYYLSDTLGYISQYADEPAQKIGIAVDSFVLDISIQKPIDAAFISHTETIDFPSTDEDGGLSDVDITVSGAEVGDAVFVGVPLESIENKVVFLAWVKDADTITVRIYNNTASAVNPDSGDFKIIVFK